MLNSFVLNENQVLFLALILLRIIAFIFSSAIFSSANISIPLKVLLSFVLSFLLFSIHRVEINAQFNYSSEIISLAAKEIMVGLIIGLITRFFFFAISMSGDLISTSLGLNSAQVFNPIMGSNSNTMEQFQVLLGTLVFFALQGHHLLIKALYESFTILPIAQGSLSFKSFPEVAHLGGQLMEVGFKMASPVVVSVFIVNITIGILGRTVPQLNVLMTSLSVTFSVGILVLIATLPLMIYEMNTVINLTGKYVFQIMRNL